ncbi:endonuclease/exonuclease/phosphatase family protein [Emcibacter sp.]|uniref:endonuclease/exonuclease/phosphatase family protein n=1 Tax=Emcibacter sp. TaxID=1979954 RepID=UPI002AA70EF6|nr:endonuclease/exonuclease/phosphatase family protein [Emcibacter sp.]
MPFDQIPDEVEEGLDELAAYLGQQIPPKKMEQNLLIATWNIRAFSSLTRKWLAGDNDSPKRDYWGLSIITEIISRFDVIAVQEIKGDLRALRTMMKALGPDWGFLMTDITLGDAGNNERLGFIYDTRRVTPSGLAAELVIPEDWQEEENIAPDALKRQFARTPYAVSFRAGSETFILVTLHVDYGDNADDRVPELRGIAKWMKDWANRTNRWHHNLIVLGDFNIDRAGDKLWQAFTSTGLTVPDELMHVPKSIFADPDEPQNEKFYDQVAWFTTGNKQKLHMTYKTGGYVDFVPFSYQNKDLDRNAISYRVSDHYPLWTEFEL